MKRSAPHHCLIWRSAKVWCLPRACVAQKWLLAGLATGLVASQALGQTPAWELPVVGEQLPVPSYGLQPQALAADSAAAGSVGEDPSLRILARTQALPLNFALVQPSQAWAAWSPETLGPVTAPGALAAGLPAPTSEEPFMRLWIPLNDNGQRLRLTHAFVNLTRPVYADGDRQLRPSAGVVMRLGSGPAYLQQLSLGSVFRLNVGEGAQLALRLRGGRLGLQYRLQFNL